MRALPLRHGDPQLVNLASITLFVLFPGFFLYHTGIAFGVIPPILGGGFGSSAVLLGVPLLALQSRAFLRGSTSFLALDGLVLGLSAFIVLWSTLHYALGADDQRSWDLFFYSVSATYLWLVVYAAARNAAVGGRRFQRASACAMVLFLVVTTTNASEFQFVSARMSSEDTSAAGYQGFARSALVTSMLLLSARTGLWESALFLGGLVLLFLLGARSEFAGFLFAAIPMTVLKRATLRAALLQLFGKACCAAVLAVAFDIFRSESRILELLDVGRASSYVSRTELRAHAVQTIIDHPFLGDYGSHLRHGGIGAYSHDALSAWVSYGLLGFLLFTSVLLYALTVALVAGVRDRTSPVAASAVALSVYACVQAIGAKPVYDPVFALAWGLSASAAIQASGRALPRYADRSQPTQEPAARPDSPPGRG